LNRNVPVGRCGTHLNSQQEESEQPDKNQTSKEDGESHFSFSREKKEVYHTGTARQGTRFEYPNLLL
jgi:hypothetical protein